MLSGLFIVAIKGKSPDQETIDFLKTYKPSGIIIFSYNVPDNIDDLREFIFSLKGKVGYNLFVCVDEEGGRVKRIEPPFELPPARKIGEAFESGLITDQDIFDLGQKLGAFLASLGIDVNFAPVVDLFGYNETVIGDRAFSSDPEIVSKIASAFSKGLFSSGVLPVAKHFPGHGLVKEDSHILLPFSDANEEEIQKHILPFKKLAYDVYGIMTAHIVVKNVDDFPCTLSEKWLRELKTFFPGCVITDDITMGALRDFGYLPDLAFMAFRAGCDAILMCKPDYNLASKLFEEFSKIVKEEMNDKERIFESAQRLAYLRFKRRYNKERERFK
jgi:beta-N-acetylhexosaminidase